MRAPAACVRAGLFFGAAACLSPTVIRPPQVLLHVDTDAPLPGGPLPALFDRLRVSFRPPGAGAPCDGCTQDFELTNGIVASGDASVGVALPPHQDGWTARLQMFPSKFASPLGDPDPDTTVDVTVALPAPGDDGIVDVTATLATDDVGHPVAGPVAVTPGPPTTSRAGTWPGAQRKDCTTSPREGEVCIPGGAYWMGTSHAANPPVPLSASLHPRLVNVSPFFLDSTEVTVRAVRSWNPSAASPPTHSPGNDSADDWCTLDPTPGVHDDLGVNCITWPQARAYCASRGADLPSEAQWEYAAGGLAGNPFVWGSDWPDCSYAVWGLAGYGYFGAFLHACNPPAAPGEAPEGVVDGGGHGHDELKLPTGSVYDLAGNLEEWTLDAWDEPDGDCWKTPGLYVDPVCGDPSTATAHAARGGVWFGPASLLHATERDYASLTDEASWGGFRCARADRP